MHRAQLNKMLKASIFNTTAQPQHAVVASHRKAHSLTPYQLDSSRAFWEKERVIQRLKKLRELEEICVPADAQDQPLTSSGGELEFNELHGASLFNDRLGPLYSKNLNSLRKISMTPVSALDAPGMQLEEIRPMDCSDSMLAVGLLNKIHMLDKNHQVWELCRLDNEDEIVTCLKWLSNQHIVAGTTLGSLYIFDVEKKRRVRRIKTSSEPVIALDCHLHLVAAASLDRGIKIHDLRLQHSLVLTLNGHSREVKVLKFCPRGEFLATGGSEGVLRLWEVKAHISGREESSPPHVMFPVTELESFAGSAVNDLAWCPWN